MPKPLEIRGYPPHTRQLMLYMEVYGAREAKQQLENASKTYPEYTFTLRKGK